MLKELRPALSTVVVLTVLTGIAYPLAVTGVAKAVFPWQAQGSLIEKDGHVIGSELIGQSFSAPAYFWGRPSATSGADSHKTVSVPYNAANSSGSNLGPTSKALVEGGASAIAALRSAHPDHKGPVPADLVTASASGLDPHISPVAAQYQVNRIAVARHAPVEAVRTLVARHTEGRALGVLGEPRVNVLRLNLALDEALPIK